MSATGPFRIKKARNLNLAAHVDAVYGHGDEPYIFLHTEMCSCGASQVGRSTSTLIEAKYGCRISMERIVRCLENLEYQPECPAHCSLIGVKQVDGMPGYYTAVYGRDTSEACQCTDVGKMVAFLVIYFGAFIFLASFHDPWPMIA